MVSEPQNEKVPKDRENKTETTSAAGSNEPAVSLKTESDGVSTQVRVANGVADIGKRLGQAREVRNYGIKEVAAELNLAPSIVSALEVGDMERLPEMTYIRGYLRAYARLLGLSDELDDRINLELRDRGMYEESSASRFIVSDASPLSRARPSGRSGLFKKLIFLLPILVIGTLIWLFTQRGDLVKQYFKLPELPSSITSPSSDEEEASKAEPVEQEEKATEVEVESVVEAEAVTDGASVSVPQTIESESTTSGFSSAIENPTSTTPQSVADAVIGGVTNAVTDITGNAATAVDSAVATAQEAGDSVSQAAQDILVSEEAPADENATEEDAEQSDAANDESSNNEAEEESAAVAVDARLLIRLTNDSWVQVKDGNNRVIAEGMYRAGKTITANGQVPMRITLGNASGASVSFDGADVDISSYVKGNVARFEVGG